MHGQSLIVSSGNSTFERQSTGASEVSSAYAAGKIRIEARKKLWKALRAYRLDGLKIRRPFPIGEFIVDFRCAEPRLVVELDGDQPGEQVACDSWRTGLLERRGYRVVRFWNQEVITNSGGVLEAILVTARCTNPQPFPWKGKGTGIIGRASGVRVGRVRGRSRPSS